MKTRTHKHTIGIVSLGCAKNLVDSEVLMRQLEYNHFDLILDPGEHHRIDTAIINTCGFILDAKKESIDTILRFVNARKKGTIRNLFVMGCLSERYRDELKTEMPEVDDYFGVNELRKIIERVGGEYKESLLGERRLTTPPHYAYLKIAEGCDRKCSFCSIPMIRGRHVSRPVEEIIKEARFLVQKGVREVNLISQDTTFYGLDLYHRRKLPELMQKLADIPGLDWIRLHYTYPDHFPLKVLDLIRERPNICKYIDIPLQHINTRILRSMKRGIDREGTIRIVNMIRDKIPGVAIRSTMIVGYPGETQKEFEELKEFIAGSQFDRLGVFAYSKEEDTGAAEMADNVSPKIKRQRVNELMELQQDISLHLNKTKVNGDLKVIIDRQEGIYYIGRSEADSPEIDNEVLIPVHGNELVIGDFYNVRIKSAESFDLYGEIVP